MSQQLDFFKNVVRHPRPHFRRVRLVLAREGVERRDLRRGGRDGLLVGLGQRRAAEHRALHLGAAGEDDRREHCALRIPEQRVAARQRVLHLCDGLAVAAVSRRCEGPLPRRERPPPAGAARQTSTTNLSTTC